MDIIQKTRDDYNKIAKHFSGTRYDTWPELEQFKPFLANGQCILDWGCGNGRLLLLLKDFNVRYFGLDQSTGLVRIANEKHVADVASGKATFIDTSVEDKKFDPNFFDKVWNVADQNHCSSIAI